MAISLKIIEVFRNIFPDWHMVVVDSCGLSGGTATLWDPRWASLTSYKFFVGILLTRHIRRDSHSIHFLNLYAPYKDRVSFWNRMEACDTLKIGSRIIDGDFSDTFSMREC